MTSDPLAQLIPVLQVAIAPVILISGVGLLLLSLTNRFGRATDRARELHREMNGAGAADRLRTGGQVDVFYRRARLIQFAIIMGTLSALFAAMLILTLFFAVLSSWESTVLVSLFFLGCLTSLIVSLVAFILDIRLSLKALKLELTSPVATETAPIGL